MTASLALVARGAAFVTVGGFALQHPLPQLSTPVMVTFFLGVGFVGVGVVWLAVWMQGREQGG